MTIPLAIAARAAVAATGAGLAATRAALHERRSGLSAAGMADLRADIHVGRVAGLEDSAPPAHLARYDCRNNRLAERAIRGDGFEEAVAKAAERYGAHRVAVVLGTSTAGIAQTEDAYARRDAGGALPGDFDFAHTHDLHALPRYVRARLGLKGPAIAVSTACTSGARTVIEAGNLIAAGLADAAVVGGVDTLCRMTLHGFNALELLSSGPTRPCAADRTGISIGEAAGLMLLTRPGDSGSDAASDAMLILGAGASSDGHHMSSPHPEGLGAVAAMRGALDAAGARPDDVDYVNLHGTGTRANDAMEDRAVSALFGGAVPVSSTKGWTGHTLGASGALEAILATLCIEDDLIPGCLGVEEADPSFAMDVATGNRTGRVRRVLSNSFGFGGSNVALLIGRA